MIHQRAHSKSSSVSPSGLCGEGATNEKAAQAAGVNVANLYRWQKQPEFKAALDQAGDEALKQANARMPQTLSIALDAANRIMNDPQAPPGVEGRVALGVLNAILKTQDNLKRRSAARGENAAHIRRRRQELAGRSKFYSRHLARY